MRMTMICARRTTISFLKRYKNEWLQLEKQERSKQTTFFRGVYCRDCRCLCCNNVQITLKINITGFISILIQYNESITDNNSNNSNHSYNNYLRWVGLGTECIITWTVKKRQPSSMHVGRTKNMYLYVV